jgi:hypothetical protein
MQSKCIHQYEHKYPQNTKATNKQNNIAQQTTEQHSNRQTSKRKATQQPKHSKQII